MQETTVWLVRHAETLAPNVFNGAEADVGLSDLGRRQAAALAVWFRNLGPTAVVSSAMTRAIDTARPIAAACGLPHSVEPGLHERRVGALAGTAFSLAEGPWAETLQRWTVGDTAHTTPGAESYDDIRDRATAAWRRALGPLEGERVVVVAHGVVCKVLLLSLLEGRGPADWNRLGRVANASVSALAGRGATWRAGTLLRVPDPVAALDRDVAGISPPAGTASVG